MPVLSIISPQRPEVAEEARLLLEDGEPIFADWAAVVQNIDGEAAIRVDNAIDDAEDGYSIDSVESNDPYDASCSATDFMKFV